MKVTEIIQEHEKLMDEAYLFQEKIIRKKPFFHFNI